MAARPTASPPRPRWPTSAGPGPGAGCSRAAIVPAPTTPELIVWVVAGLWIATAAGRRPRPPAPGRACWLPCRWPSSPSSSPPSAPTRLRPLTFAFAVATALTPRSTGAAALPSPGPSRSSGTPRSRRPAAPGISASRRDWRGRRWPSGWRRWRSGPVVPGVGRAAVDVHAFGVAVDVSKLELNPLVDLRPQAHQPRTELFTVRATAPAYWRLTALDRFDGRRWSPSRPALYRRDGLGRTRRRLRRPGAAPGVPPLVTRLPLAAGGRPGGAGPGRRSPARPGDRLAGDPEGVRAVRAYRVESRRPPGRLSGDAPVPWRREAGRPGSPGGGRRSAPRPGPLPGPAEPLSRRGAGAGPAVHCRRRHPLRPGSGPPGQPAGRLHLRRDRPGRRLERRPRPLPVRLPPGLLRAVRRGLRRHGPGGRPAGPGGRGVHARHLRRGGRRVAGDHPGGPCLAGGVPRRPRLDGLRAHAGPGPPRPRGRLRAALRRSWRRPGSVPEAGAAAPPSPASTPAARPASTPAPAGGRAGWSAPSPTPARCGGSASERSGCSSGPRRPRPAAGAGAAGPGPAGPGAGRLAEALDRLGEAGLHRRTAETPLEFARRAGRVRPGRGRRRSAAWPSS